MRAPVLRLSGPRPLGVFLCRLALGLAVSAPLAGTAAAATCQITPFQLQFGIDAETHMTVRSGQTCGVSMMMGGLGRTVSGGGPNGMEIGEMPAHGVARTVGLNSWGYASKPGYTGPDRFVVLSSGEIMGRRIIRGTSRITVDVDVVP